MQPVARGLEGVRRCLGGDCPKISNLQVGRPRGLCKEHGGVCMR